METKAAKNYPPKSMTQAHVFISGFVQGVGFRHFVRSKASELELTGWIRNLPDNRVEVVFQGNKSAIEEIIKDCKKGPFLSEVDNVDFQWEDGEDKFTSFDIL